MNPLSVESQRAAAVKDGEAAKRGEQDKHRRYPGPFLTPVVLETFGRPGEAAMHWVKSLHNNCPVGQRALLSQETWQRLSSVLQRGNVALLSSAGELDM